VSNLILAAPNYINEATITSNVSFVSTLPLANIQSRIFSDIARTTNLNPTIKLTFSKPVKVGTIAIAAHNLSITATAAVNMWVDSSKASLLASSGTLQVWPRVFDSLRLNWEEPGWWYGRPLSEDMSKFTPLFVWHAPRNYYTSYIEIALSDASNTSNQIDIGRIIAATTFEPTYNASYGFQIGYLPHTEIVESLDLESTEFFDVRKPKRFVDFDLDFLAAEEAFFRIMDMQRTQGIDKEVLFAWSREYDVYTAYRSFVGRFEKLSPLAADFYNNWTNKSYRLKEIL
jgi:hypothetical protein